MFREIRGAQIRVWILIWGGRKGPSLEWSEGANARQMNGCLECKEGENVRFKSPRRSGYYCECYHRGAACST